MAPMSMACVASQSRCDEMRCSSHEDGADVARPRRHHQPDQLLHRPHVGEVVGGRRHVVHAVGVRDVLEERVELEQLLGAAVEVADDRIAVDDPLAVHLQLQAQHAVRRRVLRPEVELHLLRTVEEGVGKAQVAESDERVADLACACDHRNLGAERAAPRLGAGLRRGARRSRTDGSSGTAAGAGATGAGGLAGFHPVPVPATGPAASP